MGKEYSGKSKVLLTSSIFALTLEAPKEFSFPQLTLEIQDTKNRKVERHFALLRGRGSEDWGLRTREGLRQVSHNLKKLSIFLFSPSLCFRALSQSTSFPESVPLPLQGQSPFPTSHLPSFLISDFFSEVIYPEANETSFSEPLICLGSPKALESIF